MSAAFNTEIVLPLFIAIGILLACVGLLVAYARRKGTPRRDNRD